MMAAPLHCIWTEEQRGKNGCDPATFLASNSVLGTCEDSLFSVVIEKLNISEFVLLPH